MKKYLIIGLLILIGTNLMALSGVAYNRMGVVTGQLTLTERELSLPYNNGMQKENSGISLAINWRTPTRSDRSSYTYSYYNAKNIEISRKALLALGFKALDVENNSWIESRELYWAFEFDGALYHAEVNKEELTYQVALSTYNEQPNDDNNCEKKEAFRRLASEKTSNSRLFFLEAADDYNALVTKFSGQKNTFIVKGLAKPYYNKKQESYNLQLKHLSVSNIMIPLQYTDVFSGLSRLDKRASESPRYAVDLNWGKRFEPWVVGVKALTN